VTALLVVLALLAGYWLVGLGTLAAVGADTSQLRLVLVAPALGSAVFDLILFVFNYDGGVGVEHYGLAVAVVLLVAAAVVLAIRRPRIDPRALLVLAVCLAGLALVAGPLVTYGFNWDSAGNDDMGNYVLSALGLLHHGLVMPFDVNGILHDRDYSTFLETLHNLGSRPGSDIELAGVSAVVGRLPYQTFMPFILSLQLSGVCATGALALQAARRWWAAPIAVALLLVSPEANYGWLQQLLAQTAGLGLAAALLAVLMDGDLHNGSRRVRTSDVVPVGLIASAFILNYVELASTIALAYLTYLAILMARRRLNLAALARFLIPVVVMAFVILNGYLILEIHYTFSQATGGLAGTPLSFFGFALVPEGLAELVGFKVIPGVGGSLGTSLAIVLAALLVFMLLCGSVLSARRGVAAAVVLVLDAALGALLAHNSAAFGLFKLFMYVQPFIAATLAIWLTAIRRPALLACASALLAFMVVAQLSPLHTYVEQSRDPLDLVHASDNSLIPAFRRFLATSKAPVVSVTDNPALAKLEASVVGNRSLYFITTNVFVNIDGLAKAVLPRGPIPHKSQLEAAVEWAPRSFNLLEPGRHAVDPFRTNPIAAPVLASGDCQLVLPTGSEVAVNRLTLPEGPRQLIREPCDKATDQLVFTDSHLGEGYYQFAAFPLASLWQLESDLFYSGHTFSGVGRYLLFRVLGPTRNMRLEINFTATLLHNGSNSLPPADIVGAKRTPLPFQGRGSTRVYSQPLKPQMIDGQPYVLVDFGRSGHPVEFPRGGIQGLWGTKTVIDPRYLVGWIRDVSLVSASTYRGLRPPAAIAGFPRGLANPALQYSGLYEDGWMGAHAYAVLGGGKDQDLVVRGEIPVGVGGPMQVLINNRRVYSGVAKPGALHIRLKVQPSSAPRRVEVRFANTVRLPPPDLRPASALLSFLGFVKR
jgi:hypothetical protein